jgi:hypothetical protein
VAFNPAGDRIVACHATGVIRILPEDPFDGSFENLLPNPPAVVLFLAGKDIDLDALNPSKERPQKWPPPWTPQQIRAKKLLKKKKRPQQRTKKNREVEAAVNSEKDPKHLKGLKTEADAAEKQAQQAARKAAKAEDAPREAEASGA